MTGFQGSGLPDTYRGALHSPETEAVIDPAIFQISYCCPMHNSGVFDTERHVLGFSVSKGG